MLADYFDSVCAALESGNDMLMAVPEAYDLILEAVRTGKLQESVLDTAVWRILRVKMEYGVFDSPERVTKSSAARHIMSVRRFARGKVRSF